MYAFDLRAVRLNYIGNYIVFGLIARFEAEIVAGFFGGQSAIDIRSGGRTRLSTLSAGIFLLPCILVLGDWVARIPMAALVAVTTVVSISTFSWGSLRTLRYVPKSETAVTIATVPQARLESQFDRRQ